MKSVALRRLSSTFPIMNVGPIFLIQKAGLRVIPIPGASAVSSAISAAGSVMHNSEGRFQFLGFWPNKAKDRDKFLQDISSSKKVNIFFESPHHIKETLPPLANHLDSDRQLLICRELTKKFEEIISLGAKTIATWLDGAESLKGEFVIVVARHQENGDETPEHGTLLLWANALSPYMGSKKNCCSPFANSWTIKKRGLPSRLRSKKRINKTKKLAE